MIFFTYCLLLFNELQVDLLLLYLLQACSEKHLFLFISSGQVPHGTKQNFFFLAQLAALGSRHSQPSALLVTTGLGEGAAGLHAWTDLHLSPKNPPAFSTSGQSSLHLTKQYLLDLQIVSGSPEKAVKVPSQGL